MWHGFQWLYSFHSVSSKDTYRFYCASLDIHALPISNDRKLNDWVFPTAAWSWASAINASVSAFNVPYLSQLFVVFLLISEPFTLLNIVYATFSVPICSQASFGIGLCYHRLQAAFPPTRYLLLLSLLLRTFRNPFSISFLFRRSVTDGTITTPTDRNKFYKNLFFSR